MQPITDDMILSQKTVNTKTAAAYLGMSWWALTDMLQQGTAPFGTARLCPGGTWSYTIWPERLFIFKHGMDMKPKPIEVDIQRVIDELSKLLGELKGGAA